uniref:Acriflavine resistance protein B n=1 Tax=Podoviridae sp. ctsNK10 TaxID=2826582 RepID=A0A8S5NLR1_9CAUD|nr:MAG TPA: acriflavine resistance protein B [Podoviridae sp. ctsNK10]DAJ73316.1 MAG TPA: acriflavine resistance protein B [Caudoviricetes sp.]
MSSLLFSIVYSLFFVLFSLPQRQQQQSFDPESGSSISSSGPIVDN